MAIDLQGVKRALKRGVPVLAVDSVSEHQDHVVVVTGDEGDDFTVLDPALFSRSKRSTGPDDPGRNCRRLREMCFMRREAEWGE